MTHKEAKSNKEKSTLNEIKINIYEIKALKDCLESYNAIKNEQLDKGKDHELNSS